MLQKIKSVPFATFNITGSVNDPVLFCLKNQSHLSLENIKTQYPLKHAICWLKQKSKATISRMFGHNNTERFLLFWRRGVLEANKTVIKTNSEHPFDFNFLTDSKKQIFGMQEAKLSTKEDILTFSLFN